MTTMYSAGTISVSSAATTVSGAATAWGTSGLRAGDLLIADGQVVPIESVDDATTLTLARPWPGSSLTDALYDVVLLDDGLRALTAANALLQIIGGVVGSDVDGPTVTADGGFFGDLTGNVTGDLTGDVTGNADTATNADQLDGEHGAYYLDAANLNAGTVPDARLPIGSSIQAHGDALDDLNALGPATAANLFLVSTAAGVFAWENAATARDSMNAQQWGPTLDDLNNLGPATADGEFLVATGVGTLAWETGAVAAASMGLNTALVTCTAGGTANALTLTTGRSLSALSAGMWFSAKVSTSNTGAITVAVDGLTAVNVKTIGREVDPPAGYVRTDVPTTFYFDGTNMIANRETERGNNANGEYVKFANGWAICWQSVGPRSTLEASNYVFRSVTAITWDLPITFTDTADMAGGMSADHDFRWAAFKINDTDTVSGHIFGTVSNSDSIANHAWCMGYWF